MVQATNPTSPAPVDVDQVLRVDREHLIHPLYHPADHAKPLVMVRGEGAEIIDAGGKRYFDAPVRSVERQRRPWPHRAGPGRRRADVDAGLQQQLRRLRQRARGASWPRS